MLPLVVLACLDAHLTRASITFVQGNYTDPPTPSSSVIVKFTAAQAAGDLDVVVVGWNDSTATVTAVTDMSGNTYTRAVGPTILAGVATQSIYYAKNIAAASAGANTVTVTFSAAARYPDIRILEYNGADLNNPVDVTSAASGNSATSTSGSATTTSATDLIFGANLVQIATSGAGSGFTKRLLTSPDGDIAEDKTVTSAGSYSATAPLSSGKWIMQMVAFRTPSTVGTGPTVTGVSPNSGPTAGGTSVTIEGANFAAGATVTFAGAAATNVVVSSATTITATTPAGSAGAATVTVTVGGQSGSLAGGFTYEGTPTVTAVSPTSGSTAGGTSVTITGTNFATGATVNFGAAAATNVVVVNSTTITATTPAGPAGAVAVTEKNPGGQSGSLANGFTYVIATTTITYVQGAYATPQSAQATVTVTFAAVQTAGDLNVVVVGWNDSTATVGSVTDTRGNAYKLAVGPTKQSSVASQSIYYAANIALAAAGANAVIVSFSSAAAYPDIRILEYKGADPVSPVDVTAASTGSSATSSSGSAATTYAYDLLFGANLVQTVTTGAGSGFTKRELTSPDGDIAEDRMVAATGSYSATAPLSSGWWIMQMVAFRAAQSGGDTTPPTAPGNLTAVAAGSAQINLSWAASADNVGVTGYLIERCEGAGCTSFAQIGTSTTSSYGDSGLVSSTSYSYRVRATDAAGNLSGYSSVASVTTGAGAGTPTAPANLSASAGGLVPTVIAVQSYDNPSFLTSHTAAAFDSTGGDLIVLCASSHSGVTFTPSDSYGNTWIPIAGPVDAAASGGFDLRTAVWYARSPAVGPGHTVTMGLSASQPLVISVIVVKGSNISSPIDAISLIGSDNGTQSTNIVGPSVTTTRANDLLIGFAKVSAGAGFTSGSGFTALPAASSSFLDAETGPAATVGSYNARFTIDSQQDWESVVVAAGDNPNQVSLSWTASTETGGSISQYLVERCQGTGCTGFTQIGTSTTTTYVDSGLALSTTHNYRVRAQDTLGAVGPYSTVVTTATPGSTPSALRPPGNLTASGPVTITGQSYVGGASLTAHTTAAFDSTGGDLLLLAASSFGDVTMTPSDNFNNGWVSVAGPTTLSESPNFITQFWYAPNAIVGSGHTVTITLSSPEALAASVLVLKGADLLSPVDVASAIATDNGTQTPHVSSPSIVTSYTNDTLAGFTQTSGEGYLMGPGFREIGESSSPYLAAQTGPAPTPSTYASTSLLNGAEGWLSGVIAIRDNPSQITLSWTPAAEISGTALTGSISAYLIERCQGSGCSSFAQVGTSSGTTFTDTDLLGGTTYGYRVRARDTAGAFSPYSNVLTVSTSSLP